MEAKRTQRRWTWILSAVLVVSLTGCGMYPSKPGVWPHGPWGSVLHFISDVIDFFAHLFGNSYGFAILIVTVIVRLIILPLFIRQMRYQRRMMAMQPEIQKIRTKYKGDNQKIQQETMRLYQEAGTNPVTGCLPTLIQLPVLWALYGAILGNANLHHSTFLGIFQLGEKDPHYILPVVAALTTLLSSWVMMKNNPQQQQQKMILYIMPIFILFIGIRFPAGLVLYWIYTNLFTALQTYVFMRTSAAPAVGNAAAATVNVKPRPASAGQGSKSAGGKSATRSSVASSSQASKGKKPTQNAVSQKTGKPVKQNDGAKARSNHTGNASKTRNSSDKKKVDQSEDQPPSGRSGE